MEERKLTVHPAILFSIIKAQAGSLSKAILEAVMNSVDAGATRCDIQLGCDEFSVTDDGRGFTSRQEILDWFEVFGTPHAEGDATYGRFRMGRGQLFSFGCNTWRTGHFTMVVDIKEKGLDYILKDEKAAAPGCAIHGKLYEEIPSWSLHNTLTEIRKFVQYVSIPVYLNGVLISKDPAKEKWDLVTDDAYIKLSSTNSLAVYNLGVLVRDYSSHQLGSGGVVVSRQALQVNFARNDILQHSCDIWKRVREHIRTLSGTKVAKKSSLTDNERQFLAEQFVAKGGRRSWQDWEAVCKAAIVPTASGRNSTLHQLLGADQVTLFTGLDTRLGERLHRSREAFVLTEESLSRFGATSVEELLKLVMDRRPYERQLPKVVPFDQLQAQFQPGYEVVPLKETDKATQLIMQLLRKANRPLAEWVAKIVLEETGQVLQCRELHVGKSDAALAWTNGTSAIMLEQSFLLRNAKRGINGWNHIFSVLLHEYCHLTEDTGGHDHDQNFYELFEDLVTAEDNPIAEAVSRLAATFVATAQRQGIAVSKTAARSVYFSEKDNTLLEDEPPAAPPIEVVSKAPQAKAAKSAPAGTTQQLTLTL